MNKIINTYAYIVHLETERTKREYTDAKLYKVGEGNKKRPFTLIDKYNLDSSSIVKDLIELNLNDKVRITDGNIRNYILSHYPDVKLEVDYKVAMLLGIPEDSKRNDGFTECLIVPNKYNIVDLVIEAVEYFKKHKKEATGKPKHSYTIDYDVKHLVDLNLCNRIYNFLLRESGLGIDLYNTYGQEILLIGQFDNIFLNRIACRNNVTLFIDDTKIYESTLTLDGFNVKIIYSSEELEELMVEKGFNIVLNNSPYGRIGAEITKNIIDNIDYNVFINLLPANDYHIGKNTLYKYADLESMKCIKNGFSDANVTTHIAKINKVPNLNCSEEEFEISNYTDRSLDKYFWGRTTKSHYAIDIAIYPNLNNPITNDFSNETMFTIWQRDVANGHLPYKRNTNSYKWNVEKSIDAKYFKENCFANLTKQSIGAFCIFKTPEEKTNIVNFIYSETGFKFMSKVFTAMNVDSGIVPLRKFMPKVDWTRPWTVEEILAEYNYTEEEIKEVMNDLVNFKYMED